MGHDRLQSRENSEKFSLKEGIMNENTNHTNLLGEVAGNDLIEGIYISHQSL